jgi:hypothetical protein
MPKALVVGALGVVGRANVVQIRPFRSVNSQNSRSETDRRWANCRNCGPLLLDNITIYN